MKNDNEMPGNDRDYNVSDISGNQQKTSIQVQQSQSDPKKNDKNELKGKNNPIYIKDMPEIKPARPGIM